jgi:hypothetical protein
MTEEEKYRETLDYIIKAAKLASELSIEKKQQLVNELTALGIMQSMIDETK